MAKPAAKPSARPRSRVRLWLSLFFALPLLCVLAIYGYLFYIRVTKQPPPERLISAQPFATQNISGLNASLFTEGNQLRPAGDDVFIKFSDASGRPVDVGEVAFELQMNMPGMVMHSIGKVFRTSTTGQYRTTVEPGMAGDWNVQLSFKGPRGPAQTNFVVTVK